MSNRGRFEFGSQLARSKPIQSESQGNISKRIASGGVDRDEDEQTQFRGRGPPREVYQPTRELPVAY